MNRMGFNNDGAAVVSQRLAAWRTGDRPRPVLGVNIGKTKLVPDDDQAAIEADYVTSATLLAPYADSPRGGRATPGPRRGRPRRRGHARQRQRRAARSRRRKGRPRRDDGQLRDAVVGAAADADAVATAARPPTSARWRSARPRSGRPTTAGAADRAHRRPRRPRRDLPRPAAPRRGDRRVRRRDRRRHRFGSTWPRQARRKGCDLLVVNDVSGGAVFGSADNQAVILSG